MSVLFVVSRGIFPSKAPMPLYGVVPVEAAVPLSAAVIFKAVSFASVV